MLELSIPLILMVHSYADGGAVPLTIENIDTTLASNELVFIDFWVDWCRFSKRLAPAFDEAADKVRKHFPEAGRVVMGKVDCEAERDVASRYRINKYPTLKVIRNGQPTNREYRGQRSVEALFKFVKEQLIDPIKEFGDLRELTNLDDKRRMVIGLFDRKDVPEYEVFRRVATTLKDDCQFYVSFHNASQPLRPSGEPLAVFRPDEALSNDEDEKFTGSLNNYNEFHTWAEEKCVPLVREMTFENAERLTTEGLPFLILFHAPDDFESVNLFKDIVATTLVGEKQNVLFLTADGYKFAYPLHLLGKESTDLPLIVGELDGHMRLVPQFEAAPVAGKLIEFLEALHTSKLHREFYYRPVPATDDPSESGGQAKGPTESTPTESTTNKVNEATVSTTQ